MENSFYRQYLPGATLRALYSELQNFFTVLIINVINLKYIKTHCLNYNYDLGYRRIGHVRGHPIIQEVNIHQAMKK